MPYLGNVPATNFSTMSYQDLTGGTGTSFTLDFPAGSAQDIEVFVNNVRQEPGVAYTVAGTALTMTGSIASTDDFYVIFQGKAQQTVVPGANTITAAMLQSGAVPDAVTKGTADPTATENGTVGDLFLNKTSGELYALTDATTNQNVWTNIGDGTGVVGYFNATGGTTSTSGIYTFHTFTSSGSFVTSGSNKSMDILMVAGGGGGGAGYYAGGGGAGGMQALSSVDISAGTYTVTIGAGGAGSTNTGVNGVNGGNTSFTGQSDSVGGGGGASRLQTLDGSDGGSGGGGAQQGSTGGAGTAGQGNDGGDAGGYGGAGGGAGAVGGTGASVNYGAIGGVGLQWSPNSNYYAGGGGGGASGSQTAANVAGGNGGGGNGSRGSTDGSAGTANTGGGGGGGSNREHSASGLTGAQAGKAGGSGIVIIRYET